MSPALRPPPALIAAVLLAAPLACCATESEERFDTNDSVAVSVRAARRGAIRDNRRVTGMVRPAAGAELLVTSPQPARILEMPRAEGDRVRKGDLLVRFEIPSLDAEIEAKRADLARAEARLETARSAEKRIDGLFERGIAARREVEESHRDLAEAEAAVSEARGALQAEERLQRRATVRAPFAGVVAQRRHNPGDLVEPSASDPILRLIDPSRLQVEASVPVSELPLIAVGSPARIVGPGSYPAEEGVVQSGPAAADPATGLATVRVAFSRSTRLPAGTAVQVVVLGAERLDTVLIPQDALVREGSSSFLYTVDGEGRARRRPVEVGITSGGEAEILSGLAPGERVIVRGQQSLPDGAAVTASGS